MLKGNKQHYNGWCRNPGKEPKFKSLTLLDKAKILMKQDKIKKIMKKRGKKRKNNPCNSNFENLVKDKLFSKEYLMKKLGVTQTQKNFEKLSSFGQSLAPSTTNSSFCFESSAHLKKNGSERGGSRRRNSFFNESISKENLMPASFNWKKKKEARINSMSLFNRINFRIGKNKSKLLKVRKLPESSQSTREKSNLVSLR